MPPSTHKHKQKHIQTTKHTYKEILTNSPNDRQAQTPGPSPCRCHARQSHRLYRTRIVRPDSPDHTTATLTDAVEKLAVQQKDGDSFLEKFRQAIWLEEMAEADYAASKRRTEMCFVHMMVSEMRRRRLLVEDELCKTAGDGTGLRGKIKRSEVGSD